MGVSAKHAIAVKFSSHDVLSIVRVALVALPFLFPFVSGPSVNAWQLMASWGCVALIVLVGPISKPHCHLLIWLTLTAAAIFLCRSSETGLSPSLFACVAIAVSAMTACVGAGWAREGMHAQCALAWGLLGAGMVSTAIGLLQYYGFADLLAPWTTDPGIGQAYGNLRQRNQFATLLSMALVAVLWLHAGLGTLGRRLLIGAAVLLVTGLAASTSRTGLLQLLMIVGLAAYMARRECRGANQRNGEAGAPRLPSPLALLALVPLYFVAAWVLPFLLGGDVEGMLGRLRDGAPMGHSRMILWSNVLTLIAERPWAGWGWGELSYAHYSTFYPGPRFVEILDNAHNLPLHLAVELGIPAAVAICGGFIWLTITARPWQECDSSRLMAWGVLGVIVLHSLLEYPLWYGPFQLVFGLCLGMLWPAPEPERKAGSVRRRTYSMPEVSAVVLLVVVAWADWDYLRVSQIYLPRDERLPGYEDNTFAKSKDSWLFANQVRFAELTLMPVARENATDVHRLAGEMLHFSPEPRVILKRIESAQMLGLHDEAQLEAERFAIAFPVEYARWLSSRSIEETEP